LAWDGRHKTGKRKHQKNKNETKPIVILDTVLAIKLGERITDKAAPRENGLKQAPPKKLYDIGGET
jgi:hypothetical protein